jgi:hypothetical protein
MELVSEAIDAFDVDPCIIATTITFENSHLVAQALKDLDPTIARALYNELKYWSDNNQI